MPTYQEVIDDTRTITGEHIKNPAHVVRINATLNAIEEGLDKTNTLSKTSILATRACIDQLKKNENITDKSVKKRLDEEVYRTLAMIKKINDPKARAQTLNQNIATARQHQWSVIKEEMDETKKMAKAEKGSTFTWRFIGKALLYFTAALLVGAVVGAILLSPPGMLALGGTIAAVGAYYLAAGIAAVLGHLAIAVMTVATLGIGTALMKIFKPIDTMQKMTSSELRKADPTIKTEAEKMTQKEFRDEIKSVQSRAEQSKHNTTTYLDLQKRTQGLSSLSSTPNTAPSAASSSNPAPASSAPVPPVGGRKFKR